MVTIPVKARLGPDGTLDIHVATGLPESEVEVLLMIEPVSSPLGEWPKGFFALTFGAFADQPLKRAPQDPIENREVLR